MPPVMRLPPSPPTKTRVPVGVSTLRSRETRLRPPMSRIRSYRRSVPVEVLPGVVDDVVGAERADQAEVAGAGHAGDVGTERLGQLHGVAADATGGADDEHALAGLDPADIGQRLEGGDARNRCGRRPVRS